MNLPEQPANNLKMSGFFIEAARLGSVRILSADALPKFPAPPNSDGTGKENPSADLRR
jgi:hypothetical protein